MALNQVQMDKALRAATSSTLLISTFTTAFFREPVVVTEVTAASVVWSFKSTEVLEAADNLAQQTLAKCPSFWHQ